MGQAHGLTGNDMPLDPSIILQAGKGVVPLEDPNLKYAKLQDQYLNTIKLNQAVQGLREDQAYKQITRSGVEGDDLIKQLQQAGLPKQALETSKLQLDTQKSKYEAGKASSEALKSYSNAVLANPNEQTAISLLGTAAKLHNLPTQVTDALSAQIYSKRNDPVLLRQWAVSLGGHADDALGKVQEANLGNQTAIYRGNPVTGQADILSTLPRGVSPDAALSAQTSRASNQNTVNATLQGQSKPPPGYTWGQPDAAGRPTQLAVPGGPADTKIQTALGQDNQALNNSIGELDRLAVSANEILKHPGLSGNFGKFGIFQNFPGGEAADAKALLEKLKSQIGFSVLQNMRDNSKTGGTLGAVSEFENKALQSNLGALDKAQSYEQVVKELQKIIDYSESAKNRLRNSFNTRYGKYLHDDNQSNAGNAMNSQTTLPIIEINGQKLPVQKTDDGEMYIPYPNNPDNFILLKKKKK